MNAKLLEQLKNVDIRTVDPNTLVDLNDVRVDQSLSREERIREFIEQIGNPYCFKCGNFIVKARFSNDGVPLEDCLQGILL